MHKVVALRTMADCGHKILERAGCEVITAPDGSATEDFIRLLRDTQADAIFCRTDKVTQAMIDASPNLKVIAKQGVGIDNIDVAYATSKNLPIVYAPGGNANAVAEHTIELMLMCATRYRYVDHAFRDGDANVRYNLHNTWELRGKTLGLLGCGRIGQQVARIAAQGFGMTIVGYDPFPPMNPLVPIFMMEQDDVLKYADFVSLHTPSLPSTIHSIDYEKFCHMKSTAFFVNCARGDVIVEADLARALAENKIAGAGLDVFDREPITPENPLMQLENVVCTPHTSATTEQSVINCTTMACTSIVEALEGHNISYLANKIRRG